jgi:hypothetical protein
VTFTCEGIAEVGPDVGASGTFSTRCRTPAAPVREYFDGIAAPQKAMLVIPGGGHNVATARSGQFLALLDVYVRPLAIR